MKVKPKGADGKEQDKSAKAELLAPDEFISTTGRAFDWLQHNAQVVLGVVAVVFLAAAGLGGFTHYRDSQHTTVSWDLAQAMRTYHRPVTTAAPETEVAPEDKPFATAKEKYTAARDQLQGVVDKHGASGPAVMALLPLADCHMHLGEPDKAVAAYKKFLASVAGDDPVKFAALAGLGHALEAKGEADAARAAFQDLSKVAGKVGADEGLFHTGRLMLASADNASKDEGRKLLEKLTKDKDFEGSPLRAKAEELLGTPQ